MDVYHPSIYVCIRIVQSIFLLLIPSSSALGHLWPHFTFRVKVRVKVKEKIIIGQFRPGLATSFES